MSNPTGNKHRLALWRARAGVLDSEPTIFGRGVFKQERKWQMPLVTITYSIKAETVSDTVEVEVEDPTDRYELEDAVKDWFSEVQGEDVESPDGEVAGHEVAYASLIIENWTRV